MYGGVGSPNTVLGGRLVFLAGIDRQYETVGPDRGAPGPGASLAASALAFWRTGSVEILGS
jgi:hypothetical protein